MAPPEPSSARVRPAVEDLAHIQAGLAETAAGKGVEVTPDELAEWNTQASCRRRFKRACPLAPDDLAAAVLASRAPADTALWGILGLPRGVARRSREVMASAPRTRAAQPRGYGRSGSAPSR